MTHKHTYFEDEVEYHEGGRDWFLIGGVAFLLGFGIVALLALKGAV